MKKQCSKCKKVFPKTGEYFFEKKIKQFLKKKQEYAYYTSFRHVCKKCHGLQGIERKRKKRYKELNCTPKNYKKAYIEQIAVKKRKIKELYEIGISKNKIRWILEKVNSGYKWVSYEQWIKDCLAERKKLADKKRKYQLPEGYNFLSEMPKKERRKFENNQLSDARLANWIGLKVKDAPKELIELKRIIAEMNRIIKVNP